MRIVVEISGGADSMYAALLTKETYPEAEVHGLMVCYGQAPFQKEFIKAKQFCDRENIFLKLVEIKNLFSQGTTVGEEKADESGIAKIYTPLRNLVIGSCAASYAESIGAEMVIVGSKGLNDDGKPYSFRDSILPFYTLLDGVVKFAAYKPITINPILMKDRNVKMTKKEVYKGLLDRGYMWDSFWNCFNNGDEPCGNCNNCAEKDKLKLELDNE